MTVSKIEWTDRTWNPVRGCTRVSPGCVNCYAERLSARELPGMGSPTTGEPFARMTKGGPRWTGAVEFLPHKLAEPLSWRKPARVFVNSMSDLFHEGLTNEEVAAVFGVMAACPHLTFQVLTKRPERAVEWFKWLPRLWTTPNIPPELQVADGTNIVQFLCHSTVPLPNVGLGVSVEDQATADERIPLLLQCPAAVRFVSYEPALAPVDFTAFIGLDWEQCGSCGNRYPDVYWADEGQWARVVGGERSGLRCPECFAAQAAAAGLSPEIKVLAPPLKRLDWIIVGGESGPGARPFDVEWARSTVRQCREATVPVFVKQLGSRLKAPPGLHAECSYHERKIPGFPTINQWQRRTASEEWETFSLCDRKGGDPLEWPEDLRVREFPQARTESPS